MTKEEELLEAIDKYRDAKEPSLGFIIMAFEENTFHSYMYRINEYNAVAAVSILKHDLLNKTSIKQE
jgi:hypothetical protein